MNGADRMRATAAREAEWRTLVTPRASRSAPADRRLLEELRQLGRELIEEPVPQHMRDLLRAAKDPQD